MPVFLVAFLSVLAPANPGSDSASTLNWNRTVLQALQEHARSRGSEPAAAAEKLADVARQLATDKQLRDGDRRRLLGQIQRRLNTSGQRVLAQQIGPQGGAGGGAQAGGEALKDLIEQTIDAESWDVNGGRGHIHVFRE